MLEFENLETGASIDVSHPIGEKGVEIGRLFEDVERGRIVVMEMYVPTPMVLTIPAVSMGKRCGGVEKEFW
jgi:hypothetical protein